MRILSVSAQRPDSTGSGVYLTELVRGFDDLGQEQAVLAGVGPEDVSPFPENVAFFPVRYESAEMPFPICGMSDEMPYRSTRYRDMTQVMTAQFRAAFSAVLREAVDAFQPDVILCHHLYALTALVRELFPERRVCGICHGSDLRQIRKNPWQRDWIVSRIAELDRVFALHEQQNWTLPGSMLCLKSGSGSSAPALTAASFAACRRRSAGAKGCGCSLRASSVRRRACSVFSGRCPCCRRRSASP